jgi:hypothetical protein
MKAKKKVVATALVLGLGLLFGPRLASLTGWVTGEGVEADGSEYAPYYVDIHYLEDACFWLERREQQRLQSRRVAPF